MNIPTNPKGRYVRIPTPLKREANIKKSTNILSILIAIHKQSILREKKKLGITEYGLLWISFFRGAILALILQYFVVNLLSS